MSHNPPECPRCGIRFNHTEECEVGRKNQAAIDRFINEPKPVILPFTYDFNPYTPYTSMESSQ